MTPPVQPERAPPRYAVVVATRNRGSRIRPLLESILQSDEPDFEMVVVDQSTNDETHRAVEPFLAESRLRYVHSVVAGTSRARNRGIALTTAPIIAITDDDCTVPKDWLRRLGAPFTTHPRVGIVYCNVNPVQVDAPGHTPNIRFASSRAITGMDGLRAGQQLWMGAGMAVRRAMLADVPGFDEALGPGALFPACEDNDIAWRGLARGWWTYETGETSVLHDGFRTLDELRALVARDFYGIGGTIAKYVKTGHWRVGQLIVPLLFRFGVVEPATDILNRKLPRGFRRPYMLLRGLADGLRTPVDPESLCYRVKY